MSAQNQLEAPPRFIGIKTVKEISGLSKATIRRKIIAKEFPPPVIVESRLTRWDYGQVLEWRARKFAEQEQRLRAATEKRAA